MENVSEDEMEALESENEKEEADGECKGSSDKESLKEQECSNEQISNIEEEGFQFQELTDEEAEKLQKELDMKCKVDEKDKDGLQPNSSNGSGLTNRGSTLILPEIELSRSEKDISGGSQIAKVEQSSKIEKNPLLLSPVIRCVFRFLNIEEIKKCRLVCSEWDSPAEVALAKVALIRFNKSPDRVVPRLPVGFQSCFLNSAALFSAFEISGDFMECGSSSWTVEELSKFFHEQQRYIKELKLNFEFSKENIVKIDVNSWISKSPMVQMDVKYLTKLSIGLDWKTYSTGYVNMLDIPPLHLISHIKDLSLSKCRVNLEAGIRICAVKLALERVAFFQDGIKLDQVLINDIVDLCNAKEVSLSLTPSGFGLEPPAIDTNYVVDLRGNVSLDKLHLCGIKILNGETSRWTIEIMETDYILYSLNNQMKIKELFMLWSGPIDLFTLPISVERLGLHEKGEVSMISCSQPVVFENLQYLHIFDRGGREGPLGQLDYVFPTHFVNCPQLTHLNLEGFSKVEMKYLWMPKTVKTVLLEFGTMNWIDENYLNLEKLVLYNNLSLNGVKENIKVLFQSKIRVEVFVVYLYSLEKNNLVDFLEDRKRFSFGKTLYIGEIEWGKEKLEDSVLKDLVDVPSSFYVFENGEKGRGISKKAFRDLVWSWHDLMDHLFA